MLSVVTTDPAAGELRLDLDAIVREGAWRMLAAFIVESILCVVSIFMPVSVAAGAGAGAMAGVVVSLLASSPFEHAVTASTAATKARRFMTFS